LSRLERKLRKWRGETKPHDPDEILPYIQKWVDDLHAELRRHRGDKEFVTDMLVAASGFFEERFDDGEKTDAFVYLLGLVAKR